mmetsp:Transcript_40571/g.160889  ORF Transcript_40571/g.160889 Transcript_40571/m.160889 type:complete len:316 (-) Transcript_40571:108-1055(-)
MTSRLPHPLRNTLQRRLCLDGGLSTTLENLGADLSHGSLWSARLLRDNPDLIVRVHQSFLEAGADVIGSATYQCSLEKMMEEFGVEKPQAEQYIRLGVRLAKQAVSEYRRKSGRDAFVAAALGSYGAVLADGSEYRGNYGVSCAQIERIHTERVRCVLLESPDLVAFETIPDSDEVRTILRLMEANFSDTPFWVSLQCQSESKLADGSNLDTISAYIKELAPTSMVALGVNCVHPELVRPVIERIRSGLGSNTQILTMCYPNSGEVWEEGWKHVEGKTPSPEEWSNIVVRSGADIVGGCCRTTTSHIRLLRELLY